MRALFLTASTLLVTAACGDGRSTRQTHEVRFDVGGAVAYAGDPSEVLVSVAVTLVDVDGETYETTSGSEGLWTIEDLAPGIYLERYELDGYVDVVRQFSLDAFGENDVANPFVSRPLALMNETPLQALISPFGVDLLDGQTLFDGVAGVAAVYDVSAGDDLRVEFSIPLVSGGYAIVEDAFTSDTVIGTLDSSGSTTYVLPGEQLAAMNAGTGLMADTDVQTRHYLFIGGNAVTPIHGEAVALAAVLRFNAVP